MFSGKSNAAATRPSVVRDWREEHRNPLLAGVEIVVDGEPLTMPPVSIGALSDHLDAAAEAEIAREKAAEGGSKPAVAIAHVKMLASYVPIIHAALVRNYPALPVEVVRAGLDPGQVQGAFIALLRLSGFVELKPGEGERP